MAFAASRSTVAGSSDHNWPTRSLSALPAAIATLRSPVAGATFSISGHSHRLPNGVPNGGARLYTQSLIGQERTANGIRFRFRADDVPRRC